MEEGNFKHINDSYRSPLCVLKEVSVFCHAYFFPFVCWAMTRKNPKAESKELGRSNGHISLKCGKLSLRSC